MTKQENPRPASKLPNPKEIDDLNKKMQKSFAIEKQHVTNTTKPSYYETGQS